MCSLYRDLRREQVLRQASYICTMDQIVQQIETYRKEIEGLEIVTPQQLEEYRIKFLGTKGIVKSLFGEMRNVPNERKKEFVDPSCN